MTELGDSEDIFEDIPSNWRVTDNGKSRQTQTDQIKQVVVATQTNVPCSIAVQTEDHSGELKDDGISTSMSAFLIKVAPMVEQQLKKNLSSHAFDDYTVSWEDDRDTIVKLHALQHDWVSDVGREKKEADDTSRTKVCSDVSWNANGTVVAAAYGRTDHLGWCSHRAGLAMWNIMKRQVGRNNQADVVIETPCCLMCVQFHPELPTLVCGGLFNGEIRVWDTSLCDDSDAEPMIMSSSIDDYYHREPISQVAWVKDIHTRSYQIVSTSGDGKVLFWSMENKLAHPVIGVTLAPTASYHGHGVSKNRYAVMGGTSLSFSNLDFSNFVVGTEGGGLLRCVAAAKLAKQRNGNVKSGEFKWTAAAFKLVEACEKAHRFDVKRTIESFAKLKNLALIEAEHVFAARPDAHKLFPNASKFSFEAHQGPVYAVAASPFHRNIFLSASSDSTIRVFNILKPKPLMYLEPTASYLFDVCWSPSRPLVFAAADSEGKIHVFDLKENMLAPVIVVSVAENAPVTALAFNGKDPSLLANVDGLGRLHIWQLGPRLSSLQQNEKAVLDQMGSTTT
mmetsp:Transcript_22897/g.45280  ORF Transcript_22897/g.45280 Transcript_22897/m.45280 type:complete len:563 (-) Transcript_22897:83-1771(-)|eukprot:CAMPEP_0175156418 /NCGR_PEP_ID=MMETSP0087-20121206/21581_1 /TAXON_ID=136419 /ORGANISM="Unknown Unknown, Strain D1" /LENGTH=562 /DNA_ID=CAMNT_0016443805 /DNA_START=43 /DNA_END=1731 /DNA_ORIENTATION=+